MPGVNVQFHMLPDELVEFVAATAARHSLAVELERFYPSERLAIAADSDLVDASRDFGYFDRVWLLFRPRGCRKSERFMLNAGRLRGRRLSQAQLGAHADRAESTQVLRKVAAGLRAVTAAGLWIVTEGGNVGFSKEFRISPGAAKEARSGRIELTSAAFTQVFYVDRPEAA